MKKPNDTAGNQTRDLPTCSAVPQPTAPPRAPHPQIPHPNSPIFFLISFASETLVNGTINPFSMHFYSLGGENLLSIICG